MIEWISETTRPKNEIFICPYCNGRARYLDGLARRKTNDKRAIAKCEYIYCPWCGKRIKE